MPMKQWLYRFQPFPVYIVLTLSIAYFFIQLFLSHISHALTLLVHAYHMLCNIISLGGCIVTIKNNQLHHGTSITKLPTSTSSTETINNNSNKQNNKPFVEISLTKSASIVAESRLNVSANASSHHARTLRNTFGWTRIDVLSMLMVCIFLAALCFSLYIECIQTLIHINQQDTIHHFIPVMMMSIVGLLLNGISYLLIGGYTHHQGSFLHLTSSGNVVLDRVTTSSKNTQLANSSKPDVSYRAKHNFGELLRDFCSTIFVIICCVIVYFANDENISKFVDPIMAIISCTTLLLLSYPYMKESCYILLQTMPETIQIEEFKKDLLDTFKDIVSVHDLHIWQLTSNKLVSTAHVIFQNPIVYAKIMLDLENYFREKGITIVTIQPEFSQKLLSKSDSKCLLSIKCRDTECMSKSCCNLLEIDDDQLKRVTIQQHHNCKSHPKSLPNRQRVKEIKLKDAPRSVSLISLNVTNLPMEKEVIPLKWQNMYNSTPDVIINN